MPSELLTSREGSTLILTLSDPATRNTLSPQVYSAGVEALNVAESDARFVMSYGKVGLTPDGGGSWHLARLLPRALALEMMWLAGPVKPERLLALGLVNRVTDKGQALAEALALADKLAAM